MKDLVQMTIGLSDGERLYGFRYSSIGKSRSLYHSDDMESLYRINPELRDRFMPDSRAIVSEPLAENIHGQWIEVPESTAICIYKGDLDRFSIGPRA